MILHPRDGDEEAGRGRWPSLLLRNHPLDLLPPLVAFALATLLCGVPFGGRSLTGLALLASVHLGSFCTGAGFRCADGTPQPPEDRGCSALRATGLALSGAGLAAAVLLGTDLWSILAAIFVIGLAEAHPAIRWGDRPIGGVISAMAARGFLSFDLGILSSGTASTYSDDWRLIAGAIASIAVAAVGHRISRR